MILNLKIFYKFVNYKHFNIISISYAFKIIGPYVYTAFIDVTAAFILVPIHSTHQYLKFTFYHSFQLLHACQKDMDLL